jgi:hypothetical protein
MSQASVAATEIRLKILTALLLTVILSPTGGEGGVRGRGRINFFSNLLNTALAQIIHEYSRKAVQMEAP